MDGLRILLKMGLELTYITPGQRNYMCFAQALGFCGSLSWDTMGQFIWQRRFWALTGLTGTTGTSQAACSQFTKNSKGRQSRNLWKTFFMAREKECVKIQPWRVSEEISNFRRIQSLSHGSKEGRWCKDISEMEKTPPVAGPETQKDKFIFLKKYYRTQSFRKEVLRGPRSPLADKAGMVPRSHCSHGPRMSRENLCQQ